MPAREKLISETPKAEGPKRECILDAALALFAERGFHGTAVPLVAEKAKVGAGTLYRYFASKEALANALFQRCKSLFAGSLLSDLDPALPLREMFRRTWRNMLAFHREHPLILSFLELHNHRTYLDEQSLLVEQRALRPIRDLLAAAQKRGVLKPIGPEVAMALVFGAFVGLVRGANEGFIELTEKVVTDSEAALWEAISV